MAVSPMATNAGEDEQQPAATTPVMLGDKGISLNKIDCRSMPICAKLRDQPQYRQNISATTLCMNWCDNTSDNTITCRDILVKDLQLQRDITKIECHSE